MSTNEVGSAGEADLLILISQMSPLLDDQVWAFVSVDEVSSEYVAEYALATFREATRARHHGDKASIGQLGSVDRRCQLGRHHARID